MAKRYIKHFNNEELLERMADEFVDMHKEGYIELLHWETALEIVERFYSVQSKITFTKKEDADGSP